MSAEFKPKACPAEGEGVHAWVFHAACCAVEAGLTDEQAVEEIEFLMTRGPNPASEIEDALASARGERRRSSPRWSPVNPIAVAAVTKPGPTLRELISRSPKPIQLGGESRTAEIVGALFPGDAWVCIGHGNSVFYTARFTTLRKYLQHAALVVPSPMTRQKGRTKRGKLSYHSEANTGPRRFLIVEFDTGSLDEQAALLWHLAQYAPLALVVFSGNKSVHSWFFCANEPEDKLRRFFDYAHSLGADSRMWTRSQFARIPDGERSDWKRSDALRIAGIEGSPIGRQAVLYFNPGVIR